MRVRVIVGAALLIGLFGVGTFTSRAGDVAGSRQWTLVNFQSPVEVKGELVMGSVLIVHDSEKMARGEACTTFYRFVPGQGPREALVSFHCQPTQRAAVEQTTLSVVDSPRGCKRLTEYQVAGETEAHGIPSK